VSPTHLKHAPRTANEILVDLAVRHAHYFERLKSWLVNRVLELIHDDPFIRTADILERQLGERDVEQILAEIDAMLRDGFGAALDDMTDQLVRIGTAETAWQVKALATATPKALQAPAAGTATPQAPQVLPYVVSFEQPAEALVKAAVTSNPVAGKVLGEWFADQTQRAQEIARQVVSEGIVTGKTTPEIVKTLVGTPEKAYTDGAFQESRRNLTSIVRTATTSVATEARIATFRANADTVKAWQFVATLDNRTTLICIAHDGKVYDLSDIREWPPLHWGCRSTVVPVLKSWAELGIPGLRELPAGTRASMNGQVPATLSYGEWFKRQPAVFQDDVLGPERAALFRSGQVQVEQFVRDRRVVSLAELQAMAA